MKAAVLNYFGIAVLLELVHQHSGYAKDADDADYSNTLCSALHDCYHLLDQESNAVYDEMARQMKHLVLSFRMSQIYY